MLRAIVLSNRDLKWLKATAARLSEMAGSRRGGRRAVKPRRGSGRKKAPVAATTATSTVKGKKKRSLANVDAQQALA